MELVDLQSKETALKAQLSGESEISMVQTRAGQYRARLAELPSERDRLLLSYTEQHPDVVRVQHKIADLQEELRQEDARAETRLSEEPNALDSTATYNRLDGELQSKQDRKSGGAGKCVSVRVAVGGGRMNKTKTEKVD